MTKEILRAPAKLTLSLRVTGICDHDPFRGYHLIDAVMTKLDLHDVIEIEERPAGSPSHVTYTGRFAAGLEGTTDDTAGNDLVSRALRAVDRSARVTVTKNIPHGGGLGGGSADAAAILRWALGHTPERIPDLAVSLGADVVFCASDHDRARVRGIGEIVEPEIFEPETSEDPEPGTVTLIVPPFSVSTPAVYRAWDEQARVPSPGQRLDRGSLNDLESPATHVEPRLATWKTLITEAAGIEPTLAGSGATWFVLGDHGHLATRLPEATVIVTRQRRRA